MDLLKTEQGSNGMMKRFILLNALISAAVGSLVGLIIIATMGGSYTANDLTPRPPHLAKAQIQCHHAAGQVGPRSAANETYYPLRMSTGWYIHPLEGEFNALASQSGTDKVTTHNYGVLYSIKLVLTAGKPKVKKMLEIGLGCNMKYGPGASAWLWRKMFPEADIWFAEYDAPCVEANQEKIKALNIKVVTGDQQDVPTLRSWIHEIGNDIDLIIDDGGHTNPQQYASFMMLFQHALKPGGLYVIEDLSVSRSPYSGAPEHPAMIDVVRDWIEAMLDHKYLPQAVYHAYTPKNKMPPGIRSIECISEACAFIKCYEDDPRCNKASVVDETLKQTWSLYA